MQGCPARLRADDLQQSWRRYAKAVQISLNRPTPAPTQKGDLDEIATGNGDIQVSVPDQGHRTPTAGRCLRSRDRRGTDRGPVVSLLPPRRDADHGSRRTAASLLARDVFHQFGRPGGRAAGRRGRLACLIILISKPAPRVRHYAGAP